MRYYVLIVWGDIEPQLIGPFRSAQARDARSQELKAEHGDSHGIFPFQLTTANSPSVGAYSNAFFKGGSVQGVGK